MKLFRREKSIYESLVIPKHLQKVVEEAMEQKAKKSFWRKCQPILAVACSFCLLFVVLLKVSPNFALATSNIPVIGKLAQIFTKIEYKEETDTELVDVKMPVLENTGNSQLEKRVNQQILAKVNEVIEESKQLAREVKEQSEVAKTQLIAENSEEEITFQPMELEINYEVKHSDEKVVSFVISKKESFYHFYEERYYYNVNLKTGEDITLQEVLGDNYIQIVNTQIQKKIDETLKQDPTAFFVDEQDHLLEHGNSFSGIAKEQSFYLNEAGNPVITFAKYEIAPGYRGIMEFEIVPLKK